MKYLRNEQGNMIIFSMGIMGILLLLFLLIGSFAAVFIAKEKSSNIAQQASLVASSILKDEIEKAIDQYEIFVQSQIVRVYPSVREIIELRLASSSYSDLTAKEKRRHVTNDVLKEQIPINTPLQGYIENGVSKARLDIPRAVAGNIRSNSGTVSGTEISISDTNRIKVTTHVRYEAMKYDEFFSEEGRKVVQQGEGPSFDFLSMLWSQVGFHHKFP